MEKIAKQSSVFRVFDKTTGKYISGYKSKSSWRSLGWAFSAAKDSFGNLEDMEIHEFPTTSAIVHTYKEIKDKLESDTKQKLSKKQKAEEEQKIRALFNEYEEAERKLSELRKKILEIKPDGKSKS